MNLKHYLTPYTKNKRKWMKDLNVRPETHRRKTRQLFDISLSDIFLDISPQARATKAKINK